MISSNATWIKICISKQFKKKLDDSYAMVCEKLAMRGICRRLTKQEFVRELIDYGFSYVSKKYKLDEDDDDPRIMSPILFGKAIKKELDDRESSLVDSLKKDYSSFDEFAEKMAIKDCVTTFNEVCDLLSINRREAEHIFAQKYFETHNKQYQPIKTVDIDMDKLIGEDL